MAGTVGGPPRKEGGAAHDSDLVFEHVAEAAVAGQDGCNEAAGPLRPVRRTTAAAGVAGAKLPN